MSTCVTGTCAPIGTPVTDPSAAPPLLSPPADASPAPATPSSTPPLPPPPPADVLPPESSPPPPPDVLPPASSPPPPPDILPPASSPPPPPDVLPPDFSPPPPPDNLPPDSSLPPPPSETPAIPSPSTALPPPPPASTSPSTPLPPPPPSTTPSSSHTQPAPPTVHQPPSKSSTGSHPPPVQWSSISVSNSTSPSTGSSSVSMGLIAGVVLGGAAILIILGIFFMCCSKKKRKDEKGAERYYMPPPQGSDGNNRGNNRGQMQHYQQSNPQSAEHYYMNNLLPPPGSAFQSPSQRQASRNTSLPPNSYMNGSGNFGPNYTGSDNSNMPLSRGMGLSSSQSSFTYEELAMATNGFSNANYLGQGGFGSVHKGTLPNGKEVAIKSLKADSGQGEREFQAEIDVISRVHHKHLVSLVGYCCTGSQRMLVYEFVQNKTLEYHLYGKGRPTMDWPTRLKIALGAAKGLAYLHEDCHPKIIHRDIKGANILIDLQFEAKVADFGLAKFTEEANTHISTRVMGTFGYLAPEYASSGKLTEKSDVFSFGVMLLEFITGRPPVDRTNSYIEDCLVDWAEPLLAKAMEDGNFEPFVDPKLQNNYNHDEMARMVVCAAGATSYSAKRRPKMSQIVRALESSSSLSDISNGTAPGQSRAFGANGSPDYTSGQYKEDMKKFRKMVLQSQVDASTEYTTGTTSEYSMSSSGSVTDSPIKGMAKP